MAYERRPDTGEKSGLQGLLRQLVEDARPTETVSEERAEALDYYNQQPLGNEVDDRSQVVSSDMFDVIESAKTDLLELFAGSDEVVAFEPTGEEDEEAAKQATDYINHIWSRDNPGFENTYDSLHNALLQKTGVIKIYWQENGESKRKELESITIAGVQKLMDDPEVEIIEQSEKQRHTEDEFGQMVPEVIFDLTLKHTPSEGRVIVEVVAPEYYLKSQDWNGRDRPRLTGEERPMRVSDLVEMGYDFDRLDKIPTGWDDQNTIERHARRKTTGAWNDEQYADSDRSMREIIWRELYVRMDSNEDGIAELRQINCAGPSYEVFEDKEVDDDPYVDFSPIRMPHTPIGKAYADLMTDVVEIKSTIQRQLLDNVYQINNGRYAISSKVDLNSYLDGTPGSAVEVDTKNADVGGHISPMVPVPIGDAIYPLLEYVDKSRETRLGVSRHNQDIDPRSYNDTSGGIQQILGRSARRLLGTARLIAETGYKPSFKKILKLITERQDRPRTIRLRNKWVEIDPRSWNSEMDVTVKVGLGHGTKEQQLMAAIKLLEVQEKTINMQGGIDGPFITGAEIYNGLKKFVMGLGEKSVDPYFQDPEDPENQAPPKPEQPDPLLVLAKMEDDRERDKTQGDQKIKLLEIQLKDKLERDKLKLSRDKAETDAIIEVGEFVSSTGATQEQAELKGPL